MGLGAPVVLPELMHVLPRFEISFERKEAGP